MLNILEYFKNHFNIEERESAPWQIVAVGSQWNKNLEYLTQEFMNDPYVVIISMEEAAIYAKVQQVKYINSCCLYICFWMVAWAKWEHYCNINSWTRNVLRKGAGSRVGHGDEKNSIGWHYELYFFLVGSEVGCVQFFKPIFFSSDL